MAQHELQSTIVLNGRVDASANTLASFLDGLGNSLLTIGGTMSTISTPLKGVLTDAVSLYAEFEDHMLYIQGLGDLTKQQTETMAAAARELGATTRYTATQAAEALEFNAVAGKTYSESLDLLGVEATMAAAGNMDLEVAADQLLSALAATNTATDDASTYVDMLAMASARSKSDMEGLGEAVIRLGTTMTFLEGGTAEMLTIFGELGNRGAQNAEMGTYARNVLLSLIAPTDKSARVMDALGYSVEEVNEALEGLDTDQSAQIIERLGLEVYDEETGKLRNLFEILTDLDTALSTLSEEERNKTLEQIFNQRTLGYATGLMEAATSGSWKTLMQQIIDSEGFAEQVATQRESGLGGVLRTVRSQIEEVELTIGEVFSDRVIEGATGLGDMLMAFNSLDETKKTIIVDAMAAIAATAPALILAGTTLKLLAFATTPAGALTLAGTALAGLALALDDIASIKFGENFGDAELDIAALTAAFEEFDAQMNSAFASANEYGELAMESLDTFVELKTQFTSKVLVGQLTGSFDESDIEALRTLGSDMFNALYEGLTFSSAESSEYFRVLGEGASPENRSIIDELIQLIDTDYTQRSEEISGLGQKFNDLMTRAMTDGMSEEVLAEMQSIIDQGEQLMQDELERYREKQYLMELRKAGRVDEDSAAEYFAMLGEGLAQAKQDALTQSDEMYVAAQQLYERGGMTPEQYGQRLAAIDQEQSRLLSNVMANYTAYAETAMASVFEKSGLSQEFTDLMSVLNGEMDNMSFAEKYATTEDMNNISRMIDMMAPLIQAMADNGIETTKYDQLMEQPLEGAGDYWNAFWSGTASDFMKTYQQNVDSIQAGRVNQATADWISGTAQTVTNNISGWLDTAAQNIKDSFADPMEIYVDQDKINRDITGVVSEPYEINDLTADTTQVNGIIARVTGQQRNVPLEPQTDDIEAYLSRPGTKQVKLVYTDPGIIGGMDGYATGGRATKASIFAEAGPEWAIPEQHTSRTRDLLLAAASASGFSPQDLVRSNTVNFAPVITVADSRGMTGALQSAQSNFFAQLKRRRLIDARMSY